MGEREGAAFLRLASVAPEQFSQAVRIIFWNIGDGDVLKRATRRRFSSEDEIRILMEGIRGELAVCGLLAAFAVNRSAETVAVSRVSAAHGA